MFSPLVVEIARRLGTDPAATEETLHTLLDRIQQQVGLYGYARLAGIGTFRQQEGRLTFEVDNALAEVVNHRFAGLEPLQVESPHPPQPETTEPEAIEPEETTPEETTPEETEAEPTFTFVEPSLEDFDEEEAVSTAGASDEAAGAEQDETDEDPYWSPPEEPAEPHPLGPYPEPSYEDADFSYVPPEEAEAEAPEPFEPEDEPTVSFDPSYLPPSWPDEPEPGTPEAEREAEAEEDDTFPPPPAGGAAGSTVRWDPGEDDADAAYDEPYRETSFEETSFQETPYEDRPSERAAGPPEEAPEALPPVPPAGKPPAVQPQRHRVQRGPNRVAQEQDRSFSPWFVGVVFGVVVMGAIAWFLFRPGPSGVDPRPPLADTTALAADTQAAPPGVDTTALAADTTAAPGTGPAVETPPETPPADAGTPLRSAAGIDTAAGGYTVVVASEGSRGTAERVAARYREQGFRTGIVVGTSGGTTRYRVGLGQFPSIGQAEAARTELQGDIPQDAWVTRIQ